MKVVITLDDGCLPHVQVTDGVRERAYDTTPEIIANLFADVNGDEGSSSPWTASPLLPPHTVFWAQRNSEECLVLDIPAGQQPWVLQADRNQPTALLIPLPRLLFLFIRHEKRITKKALVAVAEEGLITPKTALFAYPLSNVYDNTTCCWHVPDQSYKFEDIPGLARSFFSTPNNWDLYHARNRSGLDYRALIAALTDRPAFPSEWLLPLGLTWTDWIAQFVPSPEPVDSTLGETEAPTGDNHNTRNGGSVHAE